MIILDHRLLIKTETGIIIHVEIENDSCVCHETLHVM